MRSISQLPAPAAHALGVVLGVCALLLGAGAAHADEALEPLVAAVDRVAAIRDGRFTPEAGADRAVAGTACRALSPFVGEPLQRLLDRSYARLDAHYERAQALIASPDAFAGFLEGMGETLAAAGVSAEAAASVRATVKQAYRPGAGGLMASYSVNLHASEVSTAVCRAFNRLERQPGPADEHTGATIASGVMALHGLVLMAAMNPAEGDAIAPQRAAAAAALGGIVVARAYAALF